jgi:putative membrane protein
VINLGGGWTAAGHGSEASPLGLVGIGGALLFAVLLGFLVVRAMLRHGRYRVVGTFGDADREAVRRAVAEVERNTVGEIVPVVLERSDDHPAARGLAALSLLVCGSALLAAWLPWSEPALVLGAQLLLGGAGYALARALPDFERFFVYEDRATAVVEEQATQEFYAAGLHRSAKGTGVLILVSLFEQRVVVLADQGIASAVEASFWNDVDRQILDGIVAGSLRDGLIAGITCAGAALAERFPEKAGDRNELPDRVIVRRQ